MDKDKEFVKLIQENQAMIIKITRVYADDLQEQEDLYQEIVFQTWKSFEQFRNASKPSTWLYRVGMNTAITNLSKRKKRIPTVTLTGLKIEYEDQDHSEKEVKIKELYWAIRKLDLIDRSIVFLYLEGKHHEEIAEIVGISKSNVGTRMSRIKEKLKKIYNHSNEQ